MTTPRLPLAALVFLATLGVRDAASEDFDPLAVCRSLGDADQGRVDRTFLEYLAYSEDASRIGSHMVLPDALCILTDIKSGVRPSVEARDSRRNSAFHLAVDCDYQCDNQHSEQDINNAHFRILRMLLANGFGRHMKEENAVGETPLMIAAKRGRMDMVGVLLRFGPMNGLDLAAQGPKAAALANAAIERILDLVSPGLRNARAGESPVSLAIFVLKREKAAGNVVDPILFNYVRVVSALSR